MKAVEIDFILQALTKYKTRFISGKYFNGDKEINNIDNYIMSTCKNHDYYPKTQDIDEIKKQLQIISDENEWPELSILKEARELHKGENHKNMQLAFPLDNKQLLILYILLFHPREEVMFITTGVGGSGKSTFLNIIKQIYGNDCASIPLSELNGFMVAQAVNKRLICSDELGKGDLDTKILKTMISKQELDVNPKYGKPYHAYCQSSLFYCCNKAPKIDVTDTGILRRIIFYERNTKIANPDTSLNHKKYTHKELLDIIIRCLDFEVVYNNWKDYFKLETYKYLMKDNSVYVCWDNDSYESYKLACSSKGIKAYSEPNWKSIKELFAEWKAEISSLDTK